MEIQLLFFGKTKKNYLSDELEAYKKKIQRFVKFSFVCIYETKNNKNNNIKLLKEEQAEIYVLQEFVNFRLDNNLQILTYIKKYLGTPYHHQEFIFENKNMSYVNIILSKNIFITFLKFNFNI